MKKNKVATAAPSDTSNLEVAQEKQSSVTQRMIGMHRGRTRRGRLFKTLSATTLCCALVGTSWWVLSQLKQPDQSWGDLIQYLAERIIG